MKLELECQTVSTDKLVITANNYTQQTVFRPYNEDKPSSSIILNIRQTSELIRFLQTHLTKILLEES